MGPAAVPTEIFKCAVSPGNPGSSVTVTGGSYSSGQATLTFGTTTAPAVGGTMVVTGISPSGYNGTFTVVSSITTSVTYALAVESRQLHQRRQLLSDPGQRHQFNL